MEVLEEEDILETTSHQKVRRSRETVGNDLHEFNQKGNDAGQTPQFAGKWCACRGMP